MTIVLGSLSSALCSHLSLLHGYNYVYKSIMTLLLCDKLLYISFDSSLTYCRRENKSYFERQSIKIEPWEVH